MCLARGSLAGSHCPAEKTRSVQVDKVVEGDALDVRDEHSSGQHGSVLVSRLVREISLQTPQLQVTHHLIVARPVKHLVEQLPMIGQCISCLLYDNGY